MKAMATAIAGTRKKPARWEGALAGLRPVALPRGRGFEPMLCTLIDEPFDDSNWTFEPKWDGLRVICRCDGGNVQLVSRRGNDQAMQFPEIVSALNAGVGGTAVVDGEIVCLDEQGHSSFRKLQQRFHVTDPATIERRQREFPSVLYLFDVLYFDRFDVREEALRKRRDVLRRAVKWSNRLKLTPSTPGKGIALYREM